jgi:uncharacterized protein YbjT (DUF2867 family)
MGSMQDRNGGGETLVLPGTGKTGRRVVRGLEARGVAPRVGSRSGEPPFDWSDATTWPAALRGVAAAYVAYVPDLAVPGAPAAIRAFTELAVRSGVRRLVLLSGRGEEEAERCERIVRDSDVEWTIIRASWFSQNFGEGFLRDMVMSGELALPVGDVAEPFVDAEDIAEIAVRALTESGHTGALYEVTGPRLLTFGDAATEIAEATGHEVRHVQVSRDNFAAGLGEAGVPAPYIELLDYLFGTVLDGRNESVTDGVERALGRTARDFGAYVRGAAAKGVWAA